MSVPPQYLPTAAPPGFAPPAGQGSSGLQPFDLSGLNSGTNGSGMVPGSGFGSGGGNPLAPPATAGPGGFYPQAPSGYVPQSSTPPSFGMTTINAGLQTSQQNAQSQSQGLNRNVYTPEQQALQNQLLNHLGGYISGQTQVPAYMTAPPQVFQAYNDAFQKSVAPGIAAQYGAGSPQIGAQQSFGNEQLAAQLYQSGLTNWLAGLGLAGNLAYNSVGQNSAAQGNQNNQQNGANVGLSSTQYGQSLLGLLLGA
jgi:hypothetical protein